MLIGPNLTPGPEDPLQPIYRAHTFIGKWAVGIRLRGFLVTVYIKDPEGNLFSRVSPSLHGGFLSHDTLG